MRPRAPSSLDAPRAEYDVPLGGRQARVRRSLRARRLAPGDRQAQPQQRRREWQWERELKWAGEW